MPGPGKINWVFDTLTPTFAKFALTSNVAIAAAVQEFAPKVEQWMKENAPWADQTGDARAGLRAELQHKGFKQVIWIYHTVDYGIFLEICNDQTYAIIIPTLEHFENEALSSMEGIFTRTNFVTGLAGSSGGVVSAPPSEVGEE